MVILHLYCSSSFYLMLCGLTMNVVNTVTSHLTHGLTCPVVNLLVNLFFFFFFLKSDVLGLVLGMLTN